MNAYIQATKIPLDTPELREIYLNALIRVDFERAWRWVRCLEFGEEMAWADEEDTTEVDKAATGAIDMEEERTEGGEEEEMERQRAAIEKEEKLNATKKKDVLQERQRLLLCLLKSVTSRESSSVCTSAY